MIVDTVYFCNRMQNSTVRMAASLPYIQSLNTKTAMPDMVFGERLMSI